jgi:hypothetical protein
MGRLSLLNYKARDPRWQRHRIQISDNCVKTALGGVLARAVVFAQTCNKTVPAQLSDICDLRF